jgi:cytohesin
MPLYWAASQNALESARLLLAAGASAACADGTGTTPLHLAAQKGLCSMAELLLDAGADPHAMDRLRWTPLHYAVASGLIPDDETRGALVRLLIRRGASQDATRVAGSGEAPPLVLAAAHGRVSLVRQLLAGGAGLFEGDEQGDDAFHAAVRHREGEVVTFLIEAGVPAGHPASDGGNAWHTAAASADPASPAFLAVLSEHRVDVNQKDQIGNSPLHAAAYFGRVELIDALLSTGARADARNEDGVLPLHLAASEGHAEVVQRLLARTAVDAVVVDGGETALHVAAAAGQVRVVEVLLAAGADPEAKDRRGGTPAHHAEKARSRAAVDLLAAASRRRRDRG